MLARCFCNTGKSTLIQSLFKCPTESCGLICSLKNLKSIRRFLVDWDRPAEAHVWSLDRLEKKIDGVQVLPWDLGFKKIFG
jgi:hypothetical protein